MRRSSNVKRAETAWISFETSPTDTPGDPGSIFLDPGQQIGQWMIDPGQMEEFFDEPTLLRSIIGYRGAVAGSVVNESVLYMGIIVCSSDTASPPQIEPSLGGHDWVWHHRAYFGRSPDAGAGASVAFGNAAMTPGELADIRSKRRIRNGQGIAFYADNVGNISVDFYWFCRQLWKN